MSKPTVCTNWRSPLVPETCDEQTYVFIPVKSPTEIRNPSRNHGYVLPNNDVYVLSHDGKKLVKLNGTASDWNAKENQQGHIKHKPFETIGKGLAVSEKGELNVNLSDPEWSEVKKKPFETLGDNLEVVDGKLNAIGGSGPKGDKGDKGDKGPAGPKGKDADMNFFNVQQVAHDNKGIGFYYRKTGHSITCEIAGISNTDLQNGWHSLTTLPESHRPVVTSTIVLMVTKGNALQTDKYATVTIQNNGKVMLRVINFKKGYEYGGNGGWTR